MDSDYPLMLGRVRDPRVSRSQSILRSGCGKVCLCMNPLGCPFPWRACATSFSAQEGAKEGERSARLFLHRELHAGVDTVQVVAIGVYQIKGECCAHVIHVSPPKPCVCMWKVDSASCSRSSKAGSLPLLIRYCGENTGTFPVCSDCAKIMKFSSVTDHSKMH